MSFLSHWYCWTTPKYRIVTVTIIKICDSVLWRLKAVTMGMVLESFKSLVLASSGILWSHALKRHFGVKKHYFGRKIDGVAWHNTLCLFVPKPIFKDSKLSSPKNYDPPYYTHLCQQHQKYKTKILIEKIQLCHK
jgi:hypothetical protein